MLKSKQKKIYELWFEYLKRSVDYKEFCEWYQKKKENPSLNIPFPKKFENIEKPSQFRKLSEPFFFINGRFGDVHKVSFNTWWAHNKGLLLKDEMVSQSGPGFVEDYLDYVERDINQVIDDFKLWVGREPTLSELKEYFIKLLKNYFPFRAYLMINPLEKSSILNKAVNKKILDLKNKKSLHKDLISVNRYRKPIGQQRLDKIERYLNAYDLKQVNYTWQEIANSLKYQESYSIDEADLKREVFRDIKKAKNIIKNVEEGYFPGKY
jgi:hypothetical protein